MLRVTCGPDTARERIAMPAALADDLTQCFDHLNSAVVALHGYETIPEIAALVDEIRAIRHKILKTADSYKQPHRSQ